MGFFSIYRCFNQSSIILSTIGEQKVHKVGENAESEHDCYHTVERDKFWSKNVFFLAVVYVYIGIMCSCVKGA